MAEVRDDSSLGGGWQSMEKSGWIQGSRLHGQGRALLMSRTDDRGSQQGCWQTLSLFV